VGASMAFQNGFFWQTVIPQLATFYSRQAENISTTVRFREG
jgi:hypothetical protein